MICFFFILLFKKGTDNSGSAAFTFTCKGVTWNYQKLVNNKKVSKKMYK